MIFPTRKVSFTMPMCYRICSYGYILQSPLSYETHKVSDWSQNNIILHSVLRQMTKADLCFITNHRPQFSDCFQSTLCSCISNTALLVMCRGLSSLLFSLRCSFFTCCFFTYFLMTCMSKFDAYLRISKTV